MKVKVKTLSGSMFVYECNPKDSVLQLKYKVFEQTGIPIFLQRFIFKTQELNNNEKLSRYNVQHDCIVHLVFNVNEMMQYQQKNPQQSKKRRGTYTKVACQNCRKAHAQCDNNRPCRRCLELGKADSCIDAPRKRKRKIKKEENEMINPPPQNNPNRNIMSNPMPVFRPPQQQPRRNNNPIIGPPNPNFGNYPDLPIKRNSDVRSGGMMNMDDGSEFIEDEVEDDDMYPGDPTLGSSWKSNFLDDNIYDEDYPAIGSPPLIDSPLQPSPPRTQNIPMNNSNQRGGGGGGGMNMRGNNNNNQRQPIGLSIDPRFMKVLDGVNPFSNLDEFLGALVGTVVQQAKEIQELRMGMENLQRRLTFVEGKQQSNIVNSSSFPDFDYDL